MAIGKLVIGYLRVSSEQAGLVAERAAIRAECERRGWRLLRIEQDLDAGGSRDQPRLRAALAACQAGKADGLLTARLASLGRSLVEVGRLLAEARSEGFNLVALDLGLDLETAAGSRVANVIAALADWQRRSNDERTKQALAVKRARGTQIGRPRSVPPAILDRIRREHANGHSLAMIADGLNTDRVPPGQGGQRWYPATIRYLLNRER